MSRHAEREIIDEILMLTSGNWTPNFGGCGEMVLQFEGEAGWFATVEKRTWLVAKPGRSRGLVTQLPAEEHDSHRHQRTGVAGIRGQGLRQPAEGSFLDDEDAIP